MTWIRFVLMLYFFMVAHKAAFQGSFHFLASQPKVYRGGGRGEGGDVGSFVRTPIVVRNQSPMVPLKRTALVALS